ncbi:MAG TPA: phospholipase D-like domain-containing protein [Thermoleophilaceae bacterium]
MIEVTPLNPGGDPLEVARRIAAFLGEAKHSLDLALYDVRLPGEPGDMVAGALTDAHNRGVTVRLAYNAEHPEDRFFPPPPSTRPELLDAMPFPTCGIPGIPDLMHHKYVVRDGEAVWTGSTNWTIDSWTLQENVIVVAGSPELAAEFQQNFDELWSTRDVDRSGHQNPRTMEVGGRRTRAWFTPGHGEELSHRIGSAIGAARRRVRIASPVITAGAVLGTLAEVAAEKRVDLRGVVDRTQMEQVVYQWRTNGHSAWKIPILGCVFERADFKGKHSTKYSPETPHDFMHAKVTVADDWVFAGSFNL